MMPMLNGMAMLKIKTVKTGGKKMMVGTMMLLGMLMRMMVVGGKKKMNGSPQRILRFGKQSTTTLAMTLFHPHRHQLLWISQHPLRLTSTTSTKEKAVVATFVEVVGTMLHSALSTLAPKDRKVNQPVLLGVPKEKASPKASMVEKAAGEKVASMVAEKEKEVGMVEKASGTPEKARVR